MYFLIVFAFTDTGQLADANWVTPHAALEVCEEQGRTELAHIDAPDDGFSYAYACPALSAEPEALSFTPLTMLP